MNSRFDWVISGHLSGPDPYCDIDLMGDARAAVVPTLGSFLPGWLLIVPRVRALSLAALSPPQRSAVLHVADQAAKSLDSFGRNVFYFEHGPRRRHSFVGCGTDQAHLHVLATDLNFTDLVLQDASVEWIDATSSDPWEQILDKLDYYILAGPSGRYIGYPKEQRSQFFRRHIAAAAGRPDLWDYREFSGYEHADRTATQFIQCNLRPQAA